MPDASSYYLYSLPMLDFRQNLSDALHSHPHKIAINVSGTDYSYDDFYQRVAGICQQLQSFSQNVETPFAIGIVIHHDLETYAAIVATWWAGLTYIPIDSAQYGSIEKSLEYGAVELVCSSLPLELDALNVLQTQGLSSKEHPLFRAVNPKAIAYKLTTSGTTGTPKVVPISYENLSAFVDSFLAMNHDLSESDRFIQQAEMFFDMSIISFLIPLCIGASVHPIRMKGIRYVEVLRTLEQQNISVLVTTPSTLELLAPFYAEISLPNLRLTFCGAEVLRSETAKQWHGCVLGNIVNLYGPSEGGIFATSHLWNPDTDNAAAVPIGRIVKNLEGQVIDSPGKVSAREGELILHGPQVFSGYENRGNQEVFMEENGKRWYRTGDVVRMDDEGVMTFVRRVDQQVKVQGKRVELSLIKNIAHQLWPRASALVELEGEGAQKRIIISLMGNIDIVKAQEKLKANLPAFYPSMELRIEEAFDRNKKQLFALLNRCAEAEAVTSFSGPDFKYVRSETSVWPNFIYDVKLKPEAIHELSQVASQNIAPNLMLVDIDEALTFDIELRNAGFKPYLQWTCQQIKDLKPAHFESRLSDAPSLVFEKVESEHQLAEWITIAEAGFGKVESEIFSTLKARGVELYITRLGTEAVSCCLLFFNDVDAGIYYLVTHPAFRKKGIAAKTFFLCLAEIYERGIRTVYNQSNHVTHDIWEQMGSEDCGNLFLLVHHNENN